MNANGLFTALAVRRHYRDKADAALQSLAGPLNTNAQGAAAGIAEARDVCHVDHQFGADLIRDGAKAGEIERARIGRAAGDDHLRPVLAGEAGELLGTLAGDPGGIVTVGDAPGGRTDLGLPTAPGAAVAWSGAVPEREMADLAREMTRQAEPALVIASDTYVAGNMRLQLPHVPVVIPDFPVAGIPAYTTAGRPVLIVWRGKKTATAADAVMPERFSSALAAADITPQEIGALSLPYTFGRQGDNFALGYAWVRPGAR